MEENSPPDLVANTGINDQGSVWYSGLLQTALDTGVQAGQAAITRALGSQTPVAQTTAPATAASPLAAGSAGQSAASNPMIWAIVAGVVLVVGWLVMSRE